MGTTQDIQFVHSQLIKDYKSNKSTIVVKEKILNIDDTTNEISGIKNRLKVYDDPKRTVYITKPQYRTHKYKKFTEDVKKCDAYVVKESEIPELIETVLNDPIMTPQKWQVESNKFKVNDYIGYKRKPSLRELCNSPYVYNADINMECLIRSVYNKKRKTNKLVYTSGALDIETSVLGDGRICVNTVICDKDIYTAVLDDFLYKYEGDKRVKASIKDIYDLAQIKLKEVLEPNGFKLHIKSFKDEADVITGPISQINKHEVDFLGIWNINYDIPKIIERSELNNIDLIELFSCKDIDKNSRCFKYKEEKPRKDENGKMNGKQHIVDYWHWLTCTSHAQWYDAMLLYARMRKSEAKEPSYGLDYISNKEIGMGKLKLEEGSHFEMQFKRFVEYVVYNILDTILIQLIENKCKNILGWINLTGDSALREFSAQTVMLKNEYSKYCLQTGQVFATCGSKMKGPYDDEFLKAGGAVLKASNVKNMGLKCIVERPSIHSMIIAQTGDLDFEAQYPNTQMAYGLSKETKLVTIVAIQNKSKVNIETFCGLLSDVHENAMQLGQQFFNLPSYQELSELFTQELTNINQKE